MLEDPRALFPFESHRQSYGPWRGCNHCGRTVTLESQHVVGRGGTLMHRYCYLYVHEREATEQTYGDDVFAASPWTQLLDRWRHSDK